VPQSSGFTDDQGNPVSREAYNRIRDEKTGPQWANIALAVLVLALIGIGLFVAVRGLRPRRGAASYSPRS
jgi:hypothetical protein